MNEITHIEVNSIKYDIKDTQAREDILELELNKANINSPEFIGIPTAPTAYYGNNTDQIATCKFVQDALKASILISINPPTDNIICTAVNVDSGDEYVGVSDANGLCGITIEKFGIYNISYSFPGIAESTVEIKAAMQYLIMAQIESNVVYTVRIDEKNSNPLTCITYYNDAADMIKGSADWDRSPIFNEIRPCLFKNGDVKKFLNPNNFNYGLDGSIADLSGDDGDVMIQFGKFAYKIWREEDETNSYLWISVTNDESVVANDNDYKYYAFSRLAEGDLDYFYRGAYKGWLDSDNKLRSLPGKTPANNKNIGTFRTYAQNNGPHYQQSTYAQLVAIQCLYIIKYGNLNGQSSLGRGVVSASAAIPTGGTEELGMNYGTTANSTTHVKLFGIEDFWGNIWEWVDGLTTSASRQIITSWNSFNNEGIPATSTTTETGLTANKSGWVSKVAGTTESGFMNIAHSGSSSTYFCVSGDLCASCVLYFGGGWNSGGNAGPFRLAADCGASYASSYVGARLSYL